MKLVTLNFMKPADRDRVIQEKQQSRWMSRNLVAEAEPLLQRCVEIDETADFPPWYEHFARAALAYTRGLLGKPGAAEQLREEYEVLLALPRTPQAPLNQVNIFMEKLQGRQTPPGAVPPSQEPTESAPPGAP